MGELIIILIIALVVLGPERLPQVSRALGKAVRSVKKYVHEAAEELDGVEEIKEIRRDVQGIQKDIRSMGESLERSVAEDAQKIQKDMKTAEDELNDAIRAEPTAEKTDRSGEEPAPEEKTIQEEN